MKIIPNVMRNIALILFLVQPLFSFSQEATLFHQDGSITKTKVYATSDQQLFATSGTYNWESLDSVYTTDKALQAKAQGKVGGYPVAKTAAIHTELKQDKIITHKQDTIICHITESQEMIIKYRYPNEESINSITKNSVRKVLFASGRVQSISEKVIVNGENDWEKVQITNLESDIVGLAKVKTFSEKALGFTASTQGRVEQRATEKLKRDAAKAGCHILLILTTTGKSATFFSSATSSITAIGYKY